MKLFFLERGKILFRGIPLQNGRIVMNNVMPPQPTYYALEPKVAKIYTTEPQGVICSVYVTRKLYLLDMRFVSTVVKLIQFYRAQHDRTMVDQIRTAYFYGMDSRSDPQLKQFRRHSIYDLDRKIIQQLCIDKDQYSWTKKRIDGFIFPRMTDWRSDVQTFHSEIILCDPPQSVMIKACPEIESDTIPKHLTLQQLSQNTYQQISLDVQQELDKHKRTKSPLEITPHMYPDLMKYAYPFQQQIISRSSAFSIILLNHYYLKLTSNHQLTRKKANQYVSFPLILKITKYNYELHRMHHLDPHSKSFLDSYLLEYVNGLWINELIQNETLLRPFFVYTYDIAFIEDNRRSQQFLRQVQTQDIDYSYFDLNSLDLVPSPQASSVSELVKRDPRRLCQMYEQSGFTILYQEAITPHQSVQSFLLERSMSRRDKLIYIIKICFAVYWVLNHIHHLPNKHFNKFTHNDLHLSNVLLDPFKSEKWVIQAGTRDEFQLNIDKVPVLIDYGRCNTYNSYRFLQDTKGDATCRNTRTISFKNSWNPSIDLLFFKLIRDHYATHLRTRSQDPAILQLSLDFEALLANIPQDAYFDQVMAMPTRVSYEQWATQFVVARGDLRSIRDISIAYSELDRLIQKHRFFFEDDSMDISP